jgi:integrase
MRKVGKLNALAIRSVDLTKPGLHGDGGNLWLQVSAFGTLSWLFRYTRDGVAKSVGLGALHTVTLAEAREKARRLRQTLLDGDDPLLLKRAKRAERKLEAARAVSFKDCAEKYIEAHKAGWRNEKHGSQWSSTLATFAYPVIGDLPVQAIDTGLVLRVLEPIWTSKNETASRLRGRLESILDWAKVREYRTGENPARWRGHLDHTLPAPGKVQGDAHHPAMPYAALPSFMAALRAREGATARCLEFLIFTASRAGEVVGARGSEIDLVARTWTIPGSRMKSGREHRVPLPDKALAILAELPREGELVFPGVRVARLLALVREMGEARATVHGFRSTFADWLNEATGYGRELGEIALAHAVGDETERSYRRGDMLAKRARMMSDWAAYCEQPPAERGEVIPIRKGA